jgi:peptidoglycan-associated lipoprotein
MKLKNLLNLLVLGSVLTITAVGCTTHPQKPTVLPNDHGNIKDPNLGDNPSAGRPLDPGPAVDTRGQSQFPSTTTPPTSGFGHQGWAEDPMTLKSDTVYFDFDKSSIKAGERSKLDHVADYLKNNGGVAIRIEGNCDQRGTEEYNKSLGERRALAAREYLIGLGVAADRVDTLTRGEDNPADTGHGEAAWAKNRRDEFIVLTAPRVQ